MPVVITSKEMANFMSHCTNSIVSSSVLNNSHAPRHTITVTTGTTNIGKTNNTTPPSRLHILSRQSHNQVMFGHPSLFVVIPCHAVKGRTSLKSCGVSSTSMKKRHRCCRCSNHNSGQDQLYPRTVQLGVHGVDAVEMFLDILPGPRLTATKRFVEAVVDTDQNLGVDGAWQRLGLDPRIISQVGLVGWVFQEVTANCLCFNLFESVQIYSQAIITIFSCRPDHLRLRSYPSIVHRCYYPGVVKNTINFVLFGLLIVGDCN